MCMQIMLPNSLHTDLTLMIDQYSHSASHAENCEGSDDVLYAMYVDTVCNFRMLNIVNFA